MALPPTTGGPLNLYIPPFDYGVNPGDESWDEPINVNWETLNNFANSCILKNPVAGQTITQPGTTLLSVNRPAIFGSPAVLRFGTVPSDWDSSLSRTAPGVFTLDSNTPGDAQATLNLATANATAGFQINGAAPLNHLLVGNGTRYVDSATIPSGAAAYQVVEENETPLTQRNVLNVLTPLTAVDDPGNGSTDIGHRTTAAISGSDYISPNLSIDQWGHITAATNSNFSAVTNSNGSYLLFPDGTIFQWGKTPNAPGSGSAVRLNITFPIPFPTAVGTLQTTPINSPNGDSNPHPMASHVDSFTLSGAVIILSIPNQITGSGYDSPILTSQYADWFAIGR